MAQIDCFESVVRDLTLHEIDKRMMSDDSDGSRKTNNPTSYRRVLFTSEVKDAEETFEAPPLKKPRIDRVTSEQRVLKSKMDSQRIRTIRECLLGVPPPPSLTNPRISIEEVVEKMDEYFGMIF
jgi:hypothetical protein